MFADLLMFGGLSFNNDVVKNIPKKQQQQQRKQLLRTEQNRIEQRTTKNTYENLAYCTISTYSRFEIFDSTRLDQDSSVSSMFECMSKHMFVVGCLCTLIVAHCIGLLIFFLTHTQDSPFEGNFIVYPFLTERERMREIFTKHQNKQYWNYSITYMHKELIKLPFVNARSSLNCMIKMFQRTLVCSICDCHRESRRDGETERESEKESEVNWFKRTDYIHALVHFSDLVSVRVSHRTFQWSSFSFAKQQIRFTLRFSFFFKSFISFIISELHLFRRISVANKLNANEQRKSNCNTDWSDKIQLYGFQGTVHKLPFIFHVQCVTTLQKVSRITSRKLICEWLNQLKRTHLSVRDWERQKKIDRKFWQTTFDAVKCVCFVVARNNWDIESRGSDVRQRIECVFSK